jgi:hypothetical protein
MPGSPKLFEQPCSSKRCGRREMTEKDKSLFWWCDSYNMAVMSQGQPSVLGHTWVSFMGADGGLPSAWRLTRWCPLSGSFQPLSFSCFWVPLPLEGLWGNSWVLAKGQGAGCSLSACMSSNSLPLLLRLKTQPGKPSCRSCKGESKTGSYSIVTAKVIPTTSCGSQLAFFAAFT